MLDPSSLPALYESSSESSLSDPVNSPAVPGTTERNKSQSRSTGGVMSCGTVHQLLGSSGTYKKNPIVNCRQNVAIATQVISPSAIGGSLHRRRLVRHFGPVEEEEDEEDIFSRKRRFDWGKIACYSISIVLTLLLMTGVVLAVGYLQSEKQKILTRSSKLDQIPNILPDTTESRSLGPGIIIPILPTDESSHGALESDYFDDSEIEGELRTLESFNDTVSENGTNPEDESVSKVTPDLVNNEIENNGSIHQETPTQTQPVEQVKSLHQIPSEVKVLPPKDFKFQGFSFEIPIYNVSDELEDDNTRRISISVKTKLNELDNLVLDKPEPSQVTLDPKVTESSNIVKTVLAASDLKSENSDNPPPVVAKLQTDLFDEGSDEDAMVKESKAHRDHPPKVTVLDRGYTPRPGSKVMYREKPPRPNSIKFFKNKAGFHRFSSSTTPAPEQEHDDFQPSPLDKTEVTTKAPTPAPLPPTEKPEDSTTESSPTFTNNYDFNQGFTQGSNDFEYNTQKSSAVLSNFDFQSINKASTDLPTSNFDFSQYATTDSNNNFDFSQFTTPAPSSYSHFLDGQHNNNYQVQNTYNFQQAGPTVNPYAHFLTSQTVASVMGLPSPLGANLNLNLDTSGSNNYYGDNVGVPSSVIPLDLARSYIQAGNPPPLRQTTTDFSAAAFSHNNPVYSGGAGSGGQNNYNTITQGIHLLSLLSGNIPEHLMGQGHGDQFSSGNTNQFQYFSTPNYQDNQFDSSSQATNAFLTNFNLGALGSATVPSYTPYLPASQSFQADLNQATLNPNQFQHDQMGSFSQNIISKLGKEDGLNSVTEQAAELDILGLRELMNKFSRSTRSDTSLPIPSFLQSPEPEPRRPPVKKDSAMVQTKPGVSLTTASILSQLIRPVLSISSPISGKKLIFKVKTVKAKDLAQMEPVKLEIKSGFYT